MANKIMDLAHQSGRLSCCVSVIEAMLSSPTQIEMLATHNVTSINAELNCFSIFQMFAGIFFRCALPSYLKSMEKSLVDEGGKLSIFENKNSQNIYKL